MRGKTFSPLHIPLTDHVPSYHLLLHITRIKHTLRPHKLLLHSPHTHKPSQQRRAPSLIIRAARSRPAKRLLPHHGAGALAVDIEIARGVPERVFGEADGAAVGGEDGAGEGVSASRVDEGADVCERGMVVRGVDVEAEDGAEELGGEEVVFGVGGEVDGGVDEVAGGVVVGTACEELELSVLFGVVDYFGECIERRFVDNGADEVGKGCRGADFEGFGFGDEAGFHLGPEGGRDVGAGGGAAFLALVFKGTADGVDDCVMDVCAVVDEVEILAAGFANNAWVAFVSSLCNACGNLTVETAEDGGAAGVVQTGELAVGQDSVGDFHSVTRDELNYVGGKTSFHEDLVHKVIGGDCRGRGLPNHDVAHQSRSCGEISGDGGKVERRDGIDETFQWAVFNTVPYSRRIVDRLLCIQILGVLNIEPQEVTEFRSSINLRLPSILSLSHHRRSHQLITILGTDQICSFEENSRSVSKRHRLPSRLGGKGGFDGFRYIGAAGVVVSTHSISMVGRISLSQRASRRYLA